MSSKTFTLRGFPKDPVQVGTTVRLEALVSGKLADAGRYRVDWRIVGPRSDDEQQLSDRGPKIDFAPGAPGAYTVYATRSERDAGIPTGDIGGDIGGGEDGDLFDGGTGGAGDTALPNVVRAARYDGPDNLETDGWEITAQLTGVVSPEGTVPVSLQRTGVTPTSDQVLWTIIRNRTNAIAFRHYKQFIDGVMCRAVDVRNRNGTGHVLNFTGTQAYQVLKQATDAFLMQECGIVEGDACSTPTAFLDPELMEHELASGSLEATRFLGEEPHRYGRSRPVTLDDLRTMRGLYYDRLGEDGAITLPYLRVIRDRLSDIPLKSPGEITDNCYGILRSRLTGPLAMELIWSYWHEEGMLVQAINAILARFQNRRTVHGVDPLARFDLDPLRPLANLFWGWAEDELHRLTVRRRAFEYDHEYGLTLLGRAVSRQATVDSRSRFVESFHTLLHNCSLFFKEDDDTTVLADGFPLLNALRETHLILAEGAHNQFGDLPSAARAEMLIMEWLLARPEMREFLGGRAMVPYEEEWMDRVDTMKQLQGWANTSVTHTRDMGVFGEQLLLGIRYGNWSVVNDPQQAANWARYWRPEIQRYTHAYRATTGVDLTERVDATVPGFLLRRRMDVHMRTIR
ncbi:hypothetical protein [Alloactinosynnema sp. L-07]|uniref:hypothetical protein n=1 Tax=Alloactinosynnema sp. L-07 TaxID=1653480 RepID=UPI00065F02EB|nr:hypothetical protein [Alloactinosynnema sp. L-07]CRK59234.1 hypothetical protein [Alloactinosynnema sp. L-07]